VTRAFIPPGMNGHVILTTRGRAMGAIARLVEIMRMSTEMANDTEFGLAKEGALFLLRRANYLAENAQLDTAAEADQAKAKEIGPVGPLV